MPRIRLPHAATAVTLALLAAAPARAQLGGLINRAKQAVQGPAVGTRPSDAFGQPLTEESFAAVLRGLDAELPLYARYDALRDRQHAVEDQRNALFAAHQDDDAAYKKQKSAVSDCRHDAEEKLNAKHQGEMQARATDPAVQAKMQIAVRENQTAQMKAYQAHDTAAQTRAGQNYATALMKAMGVDLHADTVVVDQQCGKLPPTPAFVVQEDSLGEVAGSLFTQWKVVDTQIIPAGASAAGMTLKDYGVARERVFNWQYEDCKAGRAAQEFPKAERKILESHKTDLMMRKRALWVSCH